MKRGARRYRDGWAVFAVDPGGTTGVSEAYVPRRNSVKESLKDARVKTYEAKGDHIEQSICIALCYLAFVSRAQLGYKMPISRIVMPIESFQLRQRNVDLSPVYVQAALEGMLIQHDVNYRPQTPANAKTFATDSRLREWGLYQTGSAHRRDANRHLALFMARALG